MSNKNNLDACKSGKDFIRYAEIHGAKIRNGNGSHFMVTTDKGGVVIPYHANHDLGTGLRQKIKKAFVLIGLAIILLACILPYVRII